MTNARRINDHRHRLPEIGWAAVKPGLVGFGGIAGMLATMEHELVEKRA